MVLPFFYQKFSGPYQKYIVHSKLDERHDNVISI
jgi:hypothetical protein